MLLLILGVVVHLNSVIELKLTLATALQVWDLADLLRGGEVEALQTGRFDGRSRCLGASTWPQGLVFCWDWLVNNSRYLNVSLRVHGDSLQKVGVRRCERKHVVTSW